MQVRYLVHAVLAAGLVLSAPLAMAQPPAADHVALGDRAHAALDPAEALKHYEAALADDSARYEALWKASRALADLAEFEPNADRRTRQYRAAEQYAQRATAAGPQDAEGHFAMARALGLAALTLGVKERIRYARRVREHALRALELDPNHPGALHVMGRWHAEVMRLSGFERFMARNFLGGRIFGAASWAEARRYMERAVEVDPDRLTHHLDLGDIYADTGEMAKAREQWDFVARGRATEYNDRHYKRLAQEKLDRG